MAPELTKSLESLFTSIRNLSSDENYKIVACVFDELPILKEEVKLKDQKVAKLSNEITGLRNQHENRLQENLELYRRKYNELEKANATLIGRITSLEGTVKERDVASVEHTRTQNALQAKLEQISIQLNAEKEKVVVTNAEISKLQATIRGKDVGLENLKDSVRSEKNRNATTNAQVQGLKDQIKSLEGTLHSSATRLKEIEGFTTKLQDIDEAVWIKRLDEVWQGAYRAVESLFKEDLAAERLEDNIAWQNLRDLGYLDPKIPLPRSNSLAAKQMRIAALLAILSRSITQHIFQPTYLLEDKVDRDEIQTLLVHLAISNSKQESFCRALLLSIFPEDQAKNATKAVERVVREIAWCIRDLVLDAEFEKFRSDVEVVVKKALEAWQMVQNTREKFEPYYELNHYVDFEWQTLSFKNSVTGAGQENTANALKDDDALLMIFPRIYVIADSDPDPVTPGVVLKKSQTWSAVQEMERNSPSSPIAGRAGQRSKEIRSRTMSNSTNGTKDFLSIKVPSGVH